MKNKRFLVLFVIVLSVALMFTFTGCSKNSSSTPSSSASGSKTAVITGTFGHVLATDSPGNKAAIFFIEELKKRTNGEIVIENHPNSELGSDRELIEAMQMGAVDFSLSGASILSPFENRLSVWNMPFLFDNLQQAQAVIDSDACKGILNASTDSTGVMILGSCENGFRQLETNGTQVKTLADLQKLKIRIPQSDFYNNLWSTMGANGSALAWGELYTALQTGVVDGAETPICNFAASGFAEVTHYFTYTNYTWDPLFLTCSKKFWDKLTPVQQDIVNNLVQETVAYQRNLVNETEASLEKELKEKYKMEFNKLSDEARAEFRKAVQPMYDNYKFQDDLKSITAVITAIPK